MQTVHRALRGAEFVLPLYPFLFVLVLLWYKHKHAKNLKINQITRQSEVTEPKCTNQTHTQGELTLAWLNLLDDSQLVADDHRRAEVSLERSRLMEESRRQNDFLSLHFFLYIDSARGKMGLTAS